MPSPTLPSRRTLLLFLTCLALSFSLQIPLAWSLIILSRTITFAEIPIDLLAPADLDTDTETISIFSFPAIGVRSISITANPPGTMSRRYLEHHTVAPNSAAIISATDPWLPADLHPALADASAWPTRTGVYSRPNMSYHVPLVSALAAGWPFPCIQGRIDFTRGQNATLSRTTTGVITDPRFFPTSGVGYLVYHPRWPAYLANTLIHATLLTALLLLLSHTLTSLRTHHRQKRNRCPTCNYDLSATPSSQPCPECGHISRRRG